jgi:hypothetical protein
MEVSMSAEIEIKETKASPSAEVLIQEARPEGWLGWYRYSPTDSFSPVYGTVDMSQRDYHRCPYPLMYSREDVIDAARKALNGRGGELRIVKVTL